MYVHCRRIKTKTNKMKNLKDTGATLEIKNGNHTFNFSVFRDNVGFVVFIKQTTKVSDLEGYEDMDDFKCTYKCVCHHSKTEHSSISFAGEKYIKNWNKKRKNRKRSNDIKLISKGLG